MTLNHNGVQSQRSIKRRETRRQRQHAGKVSRLGRRHDDFFNARLTGTLNTGALIARKGREIKMAMRINKAPAHARSSSVNVVSFACGALMTSATCVSLATGAGGTTTVSGTAIRDVWRRRGGVAASNLPTVARK